MEEHTMKNLKKIAAAILTVAVLLTTTACAARQKPAEDLSLIHI